MMSWQVVASVFQEASRDSKETLRKLQSRVDAKKSLIHEMIRFLRACQPHSLYFVCAALHYHVTLTANSEARVHAKQWLVQQLYHNTERAFSTFPALSLTDDFVDCTAEFAGPWVHTVESCQVVWPNTVAEIKQLFHQPQSQKFICFTDEGHFYEADRFVAVHRSLNDDEAFQGREDPNFHDVEWIDVRQISPSHSVVRVLAHRTMLMDEFRDFAKDMGTVITSSDEKVLRKQVPAFFKNLLWDFQLKMKNMLAQSISSSA
ncbi:hypothetical protein LEN26_019497 [Aphanomyces euteiches]|nr:hypothetical protein LEN26_019497 [Aphanomyces euteiches]